MNQKGQADACPGMFAGWNLNSSRSRAEDFESDIREALGSVVTVFTHIEPVEDELSMEDVSLDR